MFHAPRRTLRPLPEHAAPRNASAPDPELVRLVCAADAGDGHAWTQLVRRFDVRLRAIARSHRLQAADIDDVLQATWMRLFTHIHRLRHPAAIGAWLATTAHRESLRASQATTRAQLTDAPRLGERADTHTPEAELLAAERRAVLAHALTSLPEPQRRLMTLLAAEPTADYQHISATLKMPRGSIGPTRARNLARLRRHPELRALLAAEAV